MSIYNSDSVIYIRSNIIRLLHFRVRPNRYLSSAASFSVVDFRTVSSVIMSVDSSWSGMSQLLSTLSNFTSIFSFSFVVSCGLQFLFQLTALLTKSKVHGELNRFSLIIFMISFWSRSLRLIFTFTFTSIFIFSILFAFLIIDDLTVTSGYL